MEEVKIFGLKEGELHISLSGDIDLGNAEAFYQTVMEGYQANKGNVVFACEELNFIDSTTLGTFVKILKSVKVDGYTMRLTGLQAKIKKLFLICSLDSIMQLD
ncbi:MAG: STAS domain-containing protein [Clostridiales bacterium]|nr:STAS domain-containing protein [Clostridiales bacterium]